MLGQLIKAAVFGWNEVMDSVTGQILIHLGHFGAQKGDGLKILPYFYDVTIIGAKIGGMLTVMSLLAFLTSAALCAHLLIRRRRPEVLLDFLLPFGLILYTYALFLMGNDHPYVFARFGFVPHALAWTSLIAGIVNFRFGDISQPAE